MSDAIGHGTLVGFRRATTGATWGYGGTPVQCGAGHGFEVDALSTNLDSQYLRNMGVSGNGTQRRGLKGAEFVNGVFGPMDLYYEGMEVPLAMVMGTAVNPVQQGASLAYLTALKIANSRLGLWGTLAARDEVAVDEKPFVKLSGWEISVENNQQAKISFPYMSYGANFNVGSPSLSAQVVDVLPANGALTLVGAGNTALAANPSPIIGTVTDVDASLTAMVATIIYEDIDRVLRSEVWTYVPGTFTYTTKRYGYRVVSVTLSGVVGAAGADRVKFGHTNGVNNESTYSAITLPTARDPVCFGQMKFYMADADDAGTDPRATSFDQYITSLNMKVTCGEVEQVTTKDGRRTDEPRSNAFILVELGVNFDVLTDLNLPKLRRHLDKKHQRVLVEFTGPEADTGYAYRQAYWFSDVALVSGTKQLPGPGKVPMDLQMEAHRTLADTTSFPSGYRDPVVIDLVSKVTTNPLS